MLCVGWRSAAYLAGGTPPRWLLSDVHRRWLRHADHITHDSRGL